jgi:hypothetical protein
MNSQIMTGRTRKPAFAVVLDKSLATVDIRTSSQPTKCEVPRVALTFFSRSERLGQKIHSVSIFCNHCLLNSTVAYDSRNPHWTQR